MNYTEIKLKARQRAEEMHNEWLQEHFHGMKVSEAEIEEARFVEDPEQDYAGDLKRKLLLGELQPDEVEDSLTFILYKTLQDKTYDEWRNPELILREQSRAFAVPQEQGNTDRFSKHIEDFLGDKKATKKKLQKNSLDAYRDTFALFVDVMGDVVLSELTYKDGTAFRDQLMLVPTHRKKRKEYKDKSVAELIAMNIERSKCMSDRTISEHLMYLNAYLSWVVTAGVMRSNPFEKVTIEVAKNPYTPYTAEDLNTLFRSPLFVPGSQYFKRWARRSNWWLVTLAVFTGARISELLQLTTDDLIEKDGVLGFSMLDEEETKRLKSDAARRFVPVHHQLKVLGVEEYVEQLGQGLLLPAIPHGARKVGENASKWYNERYRETYLQGFKEQRKVFHSFRHTFIQESLRRNVDLLKLQAMVGHEPEQMKATKSYAGEQFNRFDANTLAEQMELVQFDGLRLEGLDWKSIGKE